MYFSTLPVSGFLISWTIVLSIDTPNLLAAFFLNLYKGTMSGFSNSETNISSPFSPISAGEIIFTDVHILTNGNLLA